MTKREIASRIKLCGVAPEGYHVTTAGFAYLPNRISVPRVIEGNLIVRLFREMAQRHPELFPPSVARARDAR